MKSKILGLVAAVLLAGPFSANAALVTWDFSGTITSSQVQAFDVVQGNPFQLSVTFDPGASLIGGNNYSGSSVEMSLTTGNANCGPVSGPCHPNPGGSTTSDRIIVFDNFNNGGTLVDEVLFSVFDTGNSTRWNVFAIGPSNIFSGVAIPSVQDPRFNVAFGVCQVSSLVTQQGGPNTFGCSPDSLLVTGSNVPEPVSIALVGIGVVGLGFSRRRKLN